MYLNVNLAPPGATNTPKTPEILDSLINLTAPLISSGYSSYQAQVNTGGGDLLSPTSTSSPCDEVSPNHWSNQSGSQTSPSSDPGGGRGCVVSMVSGTVRAGPTSSITGTPSPPVPELASPINSIEMTKSALIKEGLKFQIKSKLKAAGKANLSYLVDDVQVKEENSDSSEDEERRLRRRERNKIAATKCRNKKKEKTITLMTESESAADQNIRLKSEIDRLIIEKNKLEKLLEDPCHIASCRKGTTAPLVIITSPDTPEHLSSPSSNVDRSLASATGASFHQNISDNSVTEYPPICAVSCGSSYEANTPSSSYLNLSPCSLPSVSPNSNAAIQQHSPQLTSLSVHETTKTSLTEIIQPINTLSSSGISRIPMSNPGLETNYHQDILTYSPMKSAHQTRRHNNQHQPYISMNARRATSNQFQQSQLSPYSNQYGISTARDLDSPSTSVAVSNNYLSIPHLDKSYYGYESSNELLLAPDNLPIVDNQLKTCGSNIGKMRASPVSCSSVRYSPYDISHSHNQTGSPQLSDVPFVQNVQTDSNNTDTFLLNQYSGSDVLQNNQFFSSCTYGNI